MSPLGASAPAVPTSLAETAPAVPPATGASPAAGVSTSVLQVASEGVVLEPGAHQEVWPWSEQSRFWQASSATTCM